VKGSFALLAVSAAVLGSVAVAVPVVARIDDDVHTTATKDKQTKVRVMDNFFDPRSVEVVEDDKVSFVWKGSNRHNVRFTKAPKGASRKGSKVKREGRWSRAFGKPGLYKYVCTLFSGMRGTITVKPAADRAAGART
jgi:plastocyanin